jgi:DNA-binding NarL/FixJ family response regulator
MTVRLVVQQRLRLLREGIQLLLERDFDLEPTGMVVLGEDLFGQIAREPPDVVVLEADVRQWDPCRLAHRLQSRWPALRFVGTYARDAGEVGWTRDAGFQGLYSYGDDYRTLVDTIKTAADAPRVPIRLRSAANAAVPGQLTRREIQILQLIGAGCTSKDISKRMEITYKTVENHKQRIFCKLGVQNQAHAVAIAFRRGFLEPAAVLELAEPR